MPTTKRSVGRFASAVSRRSRNSSAGTCSSRTIPPQQVLVQIISTVPEAGRVHHKGHRPGDRRKRNDAQGWVNRYSRRWGIENSYKTIKDFLAWTTSKDFVVRLFYFGFAVLLYNMWLLVDFLVQVSLDLEHRYKPRVTAKRFLNLARKQLTAPG